MVKYLIPVAVFAAAFSLNVNAKTVDLNNGLDYHGNGNAYGLFGGNGHGIGGGTGGGRDIAPPVVPIPASIWLLGTAISALIVIARRK